MFDLVPTYLYFSFIVRIFLLIMESRTNIIFFCSDFDLYTKSEQVPNIEELKPYYQSLIDKYIPGELEWWFYSPSNDEDELHIAPLPYVICFIEHSRNEHAAVL